MLKIVTSQPSGIVVVVIDGLTVFHALSIYLVAWFLFCLVCFTVYPTASDWLSKAVIAKLHCGK